MKNYFKNINNVEELRKAYKELLKKYHPDNGGSEEETKAINAEYERLYKNLKDSKESFEDDVNLRSVLENIINLNINIEIIGNWIWCTGNTYGCKTELKETGFKWSNKKKAWYWHNEGYIRKTKKNFSLEEIRNYYGSQMVKEQKERYIAI